MTEETSNSARSPEGKDLTIALIGLAEIASVEHCEARFGEMARHAGAQVITIHQDDPRYATIPARRLAALRATPTPFVTMVECTTLAEETWPDFILAPFADPGVGIVYGPVTISSELGARYRALGRMEYGRFDGLKVWPDMPPGNAMAFRCQALTDCLGNDDGGITEADVAARLTRAGWTVAYEPRARAQYAIADIRGARLATRFHHGRIYAAICDPRQGVVGRLLGAAKAALVPAVLTYRAMSHAAAAVPPRLWLAELPWVVVMSIAWGAGEFAGYVFGVGSSETAWR